MNAPLIISHSRRFIYVHVHKTGGESITASLTPQLDRGDLVVSGDIQTWLRGKVYRRYDLVAGLDKHSSARAIRRSLPAGMWRDYYTFGFVRHPADRALSMYRYVARIAARRRRRSLAHLWYLTPAGGDLDPSSWPALRAYQDTGSFSEFIRHPLMERAPGFRPQSASLCDRRGRVLVDFVGRFENLAADFAAVQRAVGLPEWSVAWRNSTENGSDEAALDAADRDYLADRFRVDFDRFGYEP